MTWLHSWRALAAVAVTLLGVSVQQGSGGLLGMVAAVCRVGGPHGLLSWVGLAPVGPFLCELADPNSRFGTWSKRGGLDGGSILPNVTFVTTSNVCVIRTLTESIVANVAGSTVLEANGGLMDLFKSASSLKDQLDSVQRVGSILFDAQYKDFQEAFVELQIIVEAVRMWHQRFDEVSSHDRRKILEKIIMRLVKIITSFQGLSSRITDYSTQLRVTITRLRDMHDKIGALPSEVVATTTQDVDQVITKLDRRFDVLEMQALEHVKPATTLGRVAEGAAEGSLVGAAGAGVGAGVMAGMVYLGAAAAAPFVGPAAVVLGVAGAICGAWDANRRADKKDARYDIERKRFHNVVQAMGQFENAFLSAVPQLQAAAQYVDLLAKNISSSNDLLRSVNTDVDLVGIQGRLAVKSLEILFTAASDGVHQLATSAMAGQQETAKAAMDLLDLRGTALSA